MTCKSIHRFGYRGEIPRGKGEKNPGRGVKKNVKLHAYNQMKDYLESAIVPVEECSCEL